MNIKDDVVFYNIAPFKETEDIKDRCNIDYIEKELKKLFPDDVFVVKSAIINESGKYQSKANAIDTTKIAGFQARIFFPSSGPTGSMLKKASIALI